MKISIQYCASEISFKSLLRIKKLKVLLREPLVMGVSAKRYMVVFRYGVVVFWNCGIRQEKEWMKVLRPHLVNCLEEPLREETEIEISGRKEGIVGGEIRLRSWNVQKGALVSLVLGLSLVLERFEEEVEEVMGDFGVVMKSFAVKGKCDYSNKNLLKKVGFAMDVQHEIVSKMALLDKPDLVWDDSKLDQLYHDLVVEYELEERYKVLEEKLKLLFQNVEFILNYLDARRSMMLEWIIILLILFEVVLFVFEIWGGSLGWK